jgi:hypothetical protein
MARCYQMAAGFVLSLFCCHSALGQVRTVTENGVQYQETREKVLRPVTDVRYEDRTRTVYREQLETETRETERVVLLPVTEYQWESYWVNRWNPFAEPYLAYRYVPRTRMEARTEIVRCPLTTRRLVEEKRPERVPVVTRRMVEEEVIRRVAIPPATTMADTRAAPSGDIGGRQLASDPPRQASRFDWRPAGGTRGRY